MLKSSFAREWIKGELAGEMKYHELSSTVQQANKDVQKKTMFSIGLKDIANENIFECDILYDEELDRYYLLSKFHDIARYYLQEIGTTNIYYLEELPISMLRIVGNYYENQELYLKLKKRKEE